MSGDASVLYVLPTDRVSVKEQCCALKGVTTVHKHGWEVTSSHKFMTKEFCVIKTSLLQQVSMCCVGEGLVWWLC